MYNSNNKRNCIAFGMQDSHESDRIPPEQEIRIFIL